MPSDNQLGAASAVDLMKQIVTLDTAVLVLSGSLLGHVLPVPNWDFFVLGLGWLCLIISLLLSIETMSRIVMSQKADDEEWTEPPCSHLGTAAKWLFFAGVLLLVAFAGFGLLSDGGERAEEPLEVRIVQHVDIGRPPLQTPSSTTGGSAAP